MDPKPPGRCSRSRDYLLGTDRSQPRAGHLGMKIGLTTFSDERQVDRLPGILLLPFRREKSPALMENASPHDNE